MFLAGLFQCTSSPRTGSSQRSSPAFQHASPLFSGSWIHPSHSGESPVFVEASDAAGQDIVIEEEGPVVNPGAERWMSLPEGSETSDDRSSGGSGGGVQTDASVNEPISVSNDSLVNEVRIEVGGLADGLVAGDELSGAAASADQAERSGDGDGGGGDDDDDDREFVDTGNDTPDVQNLEQSQRSGDGDDDDDDREFVDSGTGNDTLYVQNGERLVVGSEDDRGEQMRGNSFSSIDDNDMNGASSTYAYEDADDGGGGNGEQWGTPVHELSAPVEKRESGWTFKWVIKSFTGLRMKRLFSDQFVVGGYKWRLSTCPQLSYEYVSIYLHLSTTSKFPSAWSRLVHIRFKVVNKFNSSYSIEKEGFHRFCAVEPDSVWGFDRLMPVDDLARGFLGQDEDLTIEADVHMCKVGRHKHFSPDESDRLTANLKSQAKRFSSYFGGSWRNVGSTLNSLAFPMSNRGGKKIKSSSVAAAADSDPSSAAKSKPEQPVPGLMQHFVCPITAEIMEDPVVAADGFTYERIGIEAWFIKHQTSPMTGVKLPHKVVVPNHTLRSAILGWKEAQS